MSSIAEAPAHTIPAVSDRKKLTQSGKPIGVDREKEIINGYVVAQEGPFKSEGRGEFDRQALRSIVRMMKEKPKGLRSRFTHPGLSSDGLGSHIGRAKNPRLDTMMKEVGTDADGRPVYKEIAMVRADLVIDPSSHSSPNGDIGKYVMDLAESDSDAMSSSLVLEVDEELRLDSKGRRQQDESGKDLPPLWRPRALHFSDVVDVGDAVDGFLSAPIAADGLPDELVRKASELLTGFLPGQTRDVVSARLHAWADRAVALRFGEQDEPPEPEPAPEPAPSDDAILMDIECTLAEMESQ